MRFSRLGLGIATILMLLNVPSYAANKYGCIYSVDPWDHIVKDTENKCVRTPWWTADKDTPECGATVVEQIAAPTRCEKTTLGTDTLFDFNRTDLKEQGRHRLDQLSSEISRAERVVNIKIIGHTDAKGSDTYNMHLGQRRAETVANYLAYKQVPARKIVTSSMGESQPVAPNILPNGKDNPIGRAQNRRVEITTITEMCHE